ncbi:MAG: glycogen debranching protein GlgX, partial [Frankiaceae bacterium]|nr:glycogen debranching protein GlgX [Frankiaceae bacterium]
HFVSEPALLRRGLTNYWGYNTLGYFAPHAEYASSDAPGRQVQEFKQLVKTLHEAADDNFLQEKFLRNYWGYSTLGYFAPEQHYASRTRPGAQVGEFKAMVKALHAAGIEVLLDVVYNHTSEGNHLGPTLSLKGIDNPSYYRLRDEDPRFYLDYTGTGNTLNAQQPHVLQLIMDSLRYWVTEMHVDGFRFDLASALARSFHDVDKLSAFFDIIQQDPVLSRVKLIAEPWDLGPGGYLVGEFPPLWTEWNGQYRDTIRDFWRGAESGVAGLASRLSGSSDLYQGDGRKPYASINFVTCHDGFTLRDLVSYEAKHNEANGENNKDGNDDNRSWNCGVEGDTDDPAVVAVRARQMRNFLTTLLLSTGVPMLRMGDELAHTQHGNNNAYCQDNELSWLDWSPSSTEMLDVVARLVALRRGHPVFRQRAFFEGHRLDDGVKDLAWFRADGGELGDADWSSPDLRTVGMYLSGRGIRTRGPRGERITDDSFLLLLHAGDNAEEVRLPGPPWASAYAIEFDTAQPALAPGGHVDVSATLTLPPRSALLLRAL